MDWSENYAEIERNEKARRLALTVDYTVFFETAPLIQQGRPQVVIPLNV